MVHRIDTPGSSAGKFQAGNPFAGVSGTEVGAAWLNSFQAELVGLVEAAGLTPSKVDDAQVLAAVQALAGAGLSANQIGKLNASRPVGSPISGEFRRALEIVRAQVSGTDSGFRMPRYRSQAWGLTLGGFTVPAGYLAHGGEIKVRISGWIRPGSLSPSLGIAIRHNGTLLRPSGLFATQGHLSNGALIGNHRILRLANSTQDHAPATAALPWSFELTIESLGQNAKREDAWIGPNNNDNGDGNTLCYGRTRFAWIREGQGSVPHAMSSTNGGFWTTGTAYLKNGALWWQHGVVYTCVASHTSDATNEPGVGVDWRSYWEFAEIIHDHDHANQVDWEAEQEFTIDMGSGFQSDPDVPATWSSAAVAYSVSDYVTYSGNQYICVEAHTSDINNVPGISTGARDGERYWERSGNSQGDEIHVDRVAAYILGGAEGLGALY